MAWYTKTFRFVLHGFTNADLSVDLNGWRSTLNYVFSCESTGVSWCRMKQDSMSLTYYWDKYKAFSLVAQEKCLVEVVGGGYFCFNLQTNNYSSRQLKCVKLTTNPIRDDRIKLIIDIELTFHLPEDYSVYHGSTYQR